MLRHTLPALALLACLGLPWLAMAADPDSDGAKDEDDDKVELICRFEKVTGSHRHRRVCMTAQEMDAKRQADQEALRSFQGNRSGRSNSEAGL